MIIMVRDWDWLALLSNSFLFWGVKPKQLFPFLFPNYEIEYGST